MSSYSSYRDRALKLLPWVCARCGREFTYKNLRQLDVHHKDHDHTNNPPDGSNWELLCVYCHDDEHSRHETARAYGKPKTGRKAEPSTYKPFEGLDKLLGKDD
jgi:5-methylcytosine-specific restriction endonuclease McrA